MASLYKRGNVYWIQYWIKGRRFREAIGTDEKEALIFKKEVELKVARGEIENWGKRATGNNISLEMAKEEFFKWKGVYARLKTIQNYELILKKFLGWLAERKIISLGEITKEAIENYLVDRSREDSLKGGKITEATLNLELKSIRSFLKTCVELRLISENAAREIKPIRCRRRLPFFYSDEQIGLIMASGEPAYFKKLYLFLLLTGMRAGEICNLWWDDINLEKRRIYIRGKPDWKPKTGDRVIPISEELAMLLDAIPKIDKKYVFISMRGQKLTVAALDKRFIRLRASIGLEKGNLHAFRHTYGANITMKTGNLRALQMLLGHQKIETTQIYSHLIDENLKSVADQQKVGLATILATMKKKKVPERRLSY